MADRNPDPGLPRYAAISLGAGWNGVVLSSPCPSDVSGNVIVAPSVEQWREWLDLLVQDRRRLPGARVLKTSETVEVWETRLPRQCDADEPLRVICKQTKLHGVRDAIAGCLRPSAARRNFEQAQVVQKAGIGTAVPLAWLECRSPRASWLITEFLDGVVDIDSHVLTVLSRAEVAGNRTHRNAVIGASVQVFRGLERAGLYHRDMKASNILLAPVGEQGKALRACIVDLDGLAAYRSWRSVWKPIVRLAASLLQYPTVNQTDYARFLREYLIAGGQDRFAWRTHFPRLRKQAARYAQAAQSRKSGKLDGYSG
jgi:hypothetical protein